MRPLTSRFATTAPVQQLALLLALLVAPVLAATPRAIAAQGTSEVRASGQATVTVEPDLAIVTVQFSAGGRTPAIAGRLAATKANAIRAAIIALGIPKDSLPTAARWGRWGGRSEVQVRNDMRDTTYVTNDVFTVRIRDLSLVGRVIDTALFVGAQTISNVEFQATNTGAATIEAIKKATAMARAHAQALADGSGLRLGRVIDLGTDMQPMMLSSSFGMADAVSFRSRADANTSVVAPELKVSMTVSGRWELVGGR